MASRPITLWQIEEEKVETVTDIIFLGSKSTADSDCSHKNKRHLLLGRKAMTDLGSVLKIRDITLWTKVCIVKANGFFSSHVWMWELNHKEGWVLKTWCFQIVVLENTLGLQGDQTNQSYRKSTQNIQWKDWCWSWSSIILATRCEEQTHWKRSWYWERLRAGGEGDNRGWDGWMASLTQCTWVWVDSGSWWWTGRPGMLRFMLSQGIQHNWATELVLFFLSSPLLWKVSHRGSCCDLCQSVLPIFSL